jgi:hypothetical protein
MRPHLNRNGVAVVYTCRPSDDRKLKKGGSWSRLAWAKSETPSPKQPEERGLEAQVVEHLPSKCKDLSSNPILPKKKKKEGKKMGIAT